MTDTIIGIDLGTTNSVVGYMTDDGPQLIPNALGDRLTPSVVGIDNTGDVLVGRAAKELQVLHPDRCAGLFKRYMGSDWTTTLAGRKFTPVELSSLILRSLRDDAAAHLGRDINRAVITVPAYFNDDQRKATLRAGSLAGLDVKRIVNEPTAAAIAYGLHEAGQDKIVVVFDLGGGTFDVSVVDLFEGSVEVRASSGESFLGGEDLTLALAARVLQTQGEVFERTEVKSPCRIARLIQLCERAKLALSTNHTVEIPVPDHEGELRNVSPKVTVTRQQFVQWTESILARIEMPIRRGLGDARLGRDDVDEVILVGGSTRMPAVVERVRDLLGREPRCQLDPDEVVALGAAVQAGLVAADRRLDDLVVTDVAPFTLGVEASKQMGMELRGGYFLPVIYRNTTIPVSRVERVQTVRANQTDVAVRVFQGEGRRVEENLFLGEFIVNGVPRGPAGQEVDIRLTYDLNGVLEVEAMVVATGRKGKLVITRHAGDLSDEALESAVQAMQSLKIHPRENAVNRFLLKRAERTYRELPLYERQSLMDLIDGFEGVLEMQDAEAIERFQEELQQVLDRLDSGLTDPDQEGERGPLG